MKISSFCYTFSGCFYSPKPLALPAQLKGGAPLSASPRIMPVAKEEQDKLSNKAAGTSSSPPEGKVAPADGEVEPIELDEVEQDRLLAQKALADTDSFKDTMRKR